MEQDYYQLVTQINKAFETCDAAFLAGHVADDMQWNIIGSKPISGKSEFLKCCAQTPFQIGSVKITLNQILVDGERAAADGVIEAETLSGKPYSHQFCDIYLFDGGQLKKLTSYFDTAYVKENLASV